MDTNNLFEIGGQVNVIATAIVDFKTPQKEYKKDQVVFVLNDVNFSSNYSNKAIFARDEHTQLKYAYYTLNSLHFQNVPLTSELYSLFASDNKELVDIRSTETIVCVQNGYLLPITQNKINYESVQIDEVNNFNISTKNDIAILESDQFIAGNSYTVSFTYSKECHVIELGNMDHNIPYLKLQIQFTGNSDKQDLAGYLVIDKVHIAFTPILNFVKDGVSYCSLNMTVIQSDRLPRLVI